VFAMGKGSNGELGNGGTSTSSSPVQVKINSTTPLSNVVAISAGGFHALALTADGKVYAWGYNFFSQTGRTGGNTLYASLVTLPKLARAVAAGTYSSYALMGDGTVMAWGLDNVGQLGDGTAGGQQATPVAVQNVTLASQVSGGGAFGIALAAGGIMGWGATNVGQLGTISSTPVDPPVQTIGLPIAKQIAAGATSMYFLNMDGTVWARGAQSVGELGDNMATSGGPNWVVASSLTRTVSIAAGNQFAMAIKQP